MIIFFSYPSPHLLLNFYDYNTCMIILQENFPCYKNNFLRNAHNWLCLFLDFKLIIYVKAHYKTHFKYKNGTLI